MSYLSQINVFLSWHTTAYVLNVHHNVHHKPQAEGITEEEQEEEEKKLLRVVLAAAQEMQGARPGGGIPVWHTPKKCWDLPVCAANVCSWEWAGCQTITTVAKLRAVTHLTMASSLKRTCIIYKRTGTDTRACRHLCKRLW